MNSNPEDILDQNKQFNVKLFDQIVSTFYSNNSNRQIHDILARFEQSPNAWTKAPEIIQKSSNINSKIIALNILNSCIRQRWKILGSQSKKGIKGFVESLVVKLSTDPNNIKNIGPFLTKLNTVLIEIIKREWPHNWPGFITQVVAVSKKSEIVCRNNMNLLRLLSEEAFENESLHLSHSMLDNFKENLTKELSKVFELCMFVLKNSNDRKLIECTLKTLCKFLAVKWIPCNIIFKSQLIEALTLKYFNISEYRDISLSCLVEICSFNNNNNNININNDKLVNMFLTILKKTFSDFQLNMNTNIDKYITNNNYNFQFIQILTNFLTQFLRYHHTLLEQHNNGSRDALSVAIKLLLNITNVDSVPTLFQISCDFWEYLIVNLKNTLPKKNQLMNMNTNSNNTSCIGLYDINNSPIYSLYSHGLHELRKILMRKIPRPKEVLIERDDNGNVIKKEMKDTFMLTLHKQISKILFICSQIDPNDTRSVIGEKLTYFSNMQNNNNKQQNNMDENQFFAELNSLCWSIGAVAGSMPPDVEKSFLVVVIKILLSLCEVQQSKNAKAIIASCIMYVVRKYPRFLKKHWKFLQTVVRKLIEFLGEKHPGVQDMSIETLNEICAQCGYKFLKIQENDTQIFFMELINGLSNGQCDKLTLEQIENLYSTWSVIISHSHRYDTGNTSKSSEYIQLLLQIPNTRYQQLLLKCSSNTDEFKNEININKFIHLLRIYRGVCCHSGGNKNGSYLIQFTNLYKSLLNLYTGYAQLINSWYQSNGTNLISRNNAPSFIKKMATLKSEILQLFEIFIKKSLKKDYNQISTIFVPAFLDVILTDYTQCINKFKEYSCLNVCSELIDTLDDKMSNYIPKIFATLFQSTLDMIKNSMDNYPDHRLAFFKFLYSVVKHCFNVFEKMNKNQMELVINCIMWSHEHIKYDISMYGINTLKEFIKNIHNISQNTSNGSLITMFYKNFLFLILNKLLSVMTDTLHKAIFPQLANELKLIANDIQNNQYIGKLYDNNNNQSFNNNYEFVASKLSNFLSQKFPNLTADVIQKFIIGLFKLCNNNNNNNNNNKKNVYTQHCEDFLVEIRSMHKLNNTSNNNNNNQQTNNNNNNMMNGTPNNNNNNNNSNNSTNTMNDFNDDDI